jgi:hypothetical protein
MAITINGTTGITSAGGYTGDGVVLADNTPANTLVTTTGGNVGIGTSSPGYKFDVNGQARLGGATGLLFGVGTAFAGGQAEVYTISTTPMGLGTTGSASLQFYTGSSERARITAAGELAVGSSGTGGALIGAFKDGASTAFNGQIVMTSSGGSSNPIMLGFHITNVVASALRLESTGGGAIDCVNSAQSAFAPLRASAFNVNSDYRIKENVVPLSDALDRVMSLKPSRFSYVEGSMMRNDGRVVDGFLAHEVSDVVPEAVTGEKDAENDEGTPILQQIDHSKIVPLLTAAIQEQQALITQLKAEVDALKGAA